MGRSRAIRFLWLPPELETTTPVKETPSPGEALDGSEDRWMLAQSVQNASPLEETPPPGIALDGSEDRWMLAQSVENASPLEETPPPGPLDAAPKC